MGRSGAPAAIALGNFDGVHLGHQALLRDVVGYAPKLVPAILSFEPLPGEYFSPGTPPARLQSLGERLVSFRDAGIERVILLRFDDTLRSTSPETFLAWLFDLCGALHVTAGADFRFGAERAGTTADLLQHARRVGATFSTAPTVFLGNRRISSSWIREVLAKGDFATAQRLLGRPFTIAGRVMRGRALGRELGFPTANIGLRRLKSPLHGVFAVRASGIFGKDVPAVASLGRRPTVEEGGEELLEVHVLQQLPELYGTKMKVRFVAKLRDELRFPDLESMRCQMERDLVAAREVLDD